MANKQKIEARQQALAKRQTERTIQIVGGVVLALIVIGIVWLVVSGGSSNASNTSNTSGESGQYNAPPAMSIDPTKEYFATFKMETGGEFKVKLYADRTPITVNNFVFLARDGFYNGTTFHRVLKGFMAQGGDPEGTGMGGPGYQFEDEFQEDLVFDRPGLLAMANAGPNTNGSQFFITYAPTPHLNGRHTIFGEVIEGMDVVDGLTERDPDQAPTFQGDVIETIEIMEQ